MDMILRQMMAGEEEAVKNLIEGVFTEFIASEYSPEGINEFKKYPPISRNSYRKLIFKISGQFMQIRSWIVHIYYVIRSI